MQGPRLPSPILNVSVSTPGISMSLYRLPDHTYVFPASSRMIYNMPSKYALIVTALEGRTEFSRSVSSRIRTARTTNPDPTNHGQKLGISLQSVPRTSPTLSYGPAAPTYCTGIYTSQAVLNWTLGHDLSAMCGRIRKAVVHSTDSVPSKDSENRGTCPRTS